ncbi:MAG: hypothetical protein J6A59_02710 [Lachnospiraceae bacterium]|nr:hypothetical protein [Lachnospiraceae bacterium]
MNSKEAFDNVCFKIAEMYIDKGWSYSKSKHWLTKKTKKFIYRVYFYTSWSNISDRNVTFYGEFAIINPKNKLKYFCIVTHQCNIPENKLHWNIAKKEWWYVAIEEFTLWLDINFMPIVEECENNLDKYVNKVVEQGFFPSKGYVIDIDFVLNYGSIEQAQEAAKRFYDNLDDDVKPKFRENYESMINGGEAVSLYGKNHMMNHTNFRKIIENKIHIDFSVECR